MRDNQAFGRKCMWCGETRDEGERFGVVPVAVGHGALAPGYYPACPDCVNADLSFQEDFR